MKTVFFWLRNARYQSFPQSFLPSFLTFMLLIGKENDSNIILGIIAILGVILAHLGANLFDDYFDYSSKAVQKRREMVNGGIRARSMKCAYLDNGSTSLKGLFIVSSTFCTIAALLGTIIFYFQGISIVICLLLGAFLAFFYSAPPLKLSYHGMGEITVGLLFGPILMSGVSFSMIGELDSSVLFLSLPMGILVTNILYIHSIMDLIPDKEAGKITLAALFKKQHNAVHFCGILLLLCYLSIVFGVMLHKLTPFTLLVFLTLPIAYELYKAMLLYLTNPNQKIEKKYRHGPMENWKTICAAGIDWFMFRWFLSRNLMTFYSICLFIGISIGYYL